MVQCELEIGDNIFLIKNEDKGLLQFFQQYSSCIVKISIQGNNLSK